MRDTLNIRIEPWAKAELEQRAAAENRTVSAYVALVLERHLRGSPEPPPSGAQPPKAKRPVDSPAVAAARSRVLAEPSAKAAEKAGIASAIDKLPTMADHGRHHGRAPCSPDEEPMKPFVFRCPAILKRRIQAAAKAEGVSVNALLCRWFANAVAKR